MANRTKLIHSRIGENIRALRQGASLTQKDLAEKLYKSESTVRMWELGKSEPDNDTLLNLATIFNVSVDDILGTDRIAPSTSFRRRVARLPVLGNVAAGVPIDAITDVDDFEEIDLDQYPTGEYVALRIKGHSMEPRLLEGDVVIVRIQNTIETGETAIVMVNGDEATCKKIKKTPDGITLISTNPTYEPMFYTNKEIETLPVRIFGRVVEYRGKL